MQDPYPIPSKDDAYSHGNQTKHEPVPILQLVLFASGPLNPSPEPLSFREIQLITSKQPRSSAYLPCIEIHLQL